MKKVLNVLMVFLFVFALASCGGAETGDASGSDVDTTEAQDGADTTAAPTDTTAAPVDTTGAGE